MISKRAKGNIGEDIAVTFLKNNGFIVRDRNYLKKWGELDIVASKDGVIHFFEVKSASVDLFHDLESFHPEDNVDNLKVRHLRRIIETYLEEKAGGMDTKFQFHVLCVFVDMNKRKGRVKWLKDIIL